jgi:hypothetical protein
MPRPRTLITVSQGVQVGSGWRWLVAVADSCGEVISAQVGSLTTRKIPHDSSPPPTGGQIACLLSSVG